MNRVHCNNCNCEVGYKPPFFIGNTQWYELEVFGKRFDYCVNCKPIVEKKVLVTLEVTGKQ